MIARRAARFFRSLSFACALAALGLSVFALTTPGCSKSTSTTPGGETCPSVADGLSCSPGTCSNPGTATLGPADSHCGTTVQHVAEAACHWDGGGPDPGTVTSGAGGAEEGAGGGGSGGAGGAGAGGSDVSANADYGPTQYGNSGADDDCKYHVAWSSTPICENAGVTFTVTVLNLETGAAATGLEPFVEAFKGTTHASPNGPCACNTSTAVEGSGGVYTIGPVFFDEPGTWTVRFHFDHDCTDFSDSSPHGHAAYFVDVP